MSACSDIFLKRLILSLNTTVFVANAFLIASSPKTNLTFGLTLGLTLVFSFSIVFLSSSLCVLALASAEGPLNRLITLPS